MTAIFRSKQFLLFLLTGGMAALANFFSRVLYSRWLDFSWAVVLAYLTGMAVAFVLARLVVFTQSTKPVLQAAVFFALVNLAAVAQTLLVSMLMAHYVLPNMGVEQHVEEIAHFFGILVPAFTSYLGHKKYSFG